MFSPPIACVTRPFPSNDSRGEPAPVNGSHRHVAFLSVAETER